MAAWTLVATLFVLSQGILAAPPPKSPLKPPTPVSADEVNEDHADYLSRWHQIIQLLRTDQQLAPELENVEPEPLWDDIVIPWECPPFASSSPKPTSVHQVRLTDIKVIAALGDSITAGNGVRAEYAWQVAFPNRGESWSIGGEKSLEDRVLTLPNILRKYNTNVTGASVCARLTITHPDSEFNAAVPGDTNRGLARQARILMQKMLESEDVDYYNDWKMITIFIGGNDLCQNCLTGNENRFSANAYYEGVKAALDLFWSHLPRVIINLQPMFDVSIVDDMIRPETPTLCKRLHSIECPCSGPSNETKDALRNLQLAFFTKMQELTDGRFDSRPDMTVILQPHLRDFIPPRFENGTFDPSYIAPDCFHPSAKAHQGFAYMLWNMMQVPVGQKPFDFDLDAEYKFQCPSETNPFIYTNCNSPGAPDNYGYCAYWGFPRAVQH